MWIERQGIISSLPQTWATNPSQETIITIINWFNSSRRMNKQKLGARESSYHEVGDVVEAEVVEGDDDGAGLPALPRHPQHGLGGGHRVGLVLSAV